MRLAATLPMVALSIAAAQVRAAEPAVPAPGAGVILQQAQPGMTPAAPPAASGVPPLMMSPVPERSAVPNGAQAGVDAGSGSFVIQRIDIEGNTRIPTATLHALVADTEGKRVTMADLGELTGRITDYYHRHGYPLARALIPPQTIRGHVLRIQVIEARYGQIKLDNHSQVRDRLLRATLDSLQSGTVVEQTKLDHSLLLLSDIPGLAVRAGLEPGPQTGTSDLVVAASPSQPLFTGDVFVDNSGQSYTGKVRGGGTFTLTNPLRLGDLLSLSLLSSGSGLNYGRMSYEALLNGSGTRAGAAGSALYYQLGSSVAALDGHGTAQTASAWVKQPLVRTRKFDLYAQLQFDHLTLKDEIDASDMHTDRHLDLGTAGVSGDERDAWLGSGVTAWSADWSCGHVAFDNAAAATVDAAGPRTQGIFLKWNLGLTRLQQLTEQDALYLALSYQWANANLDPSQQLIAGGSGSVRAYDTSAISGDIGYLLTSEYRHTLGTWYGQWQAIGFFDGAHVRIMRTPLVAGDNTANLAGLGAGLKWAGPERISISVSLAAPIGERPVEVPHTDAVRVWASLNKAF